jgi:hypothetical protein
MLYNRVLCNMLCNTYMIHDTIMLLHNMLHNTLLYNMDML